MHTYQFTINGLRHHDYADCLEQLFLVAVGQPVMLCLEPDNAHDPDAVIAYLGHACLGYVRITQRAEACALIRAQGGDSLLGCVVGVDRSHRWIIVEIVADGSLPPLPESERLTLLADWCYDGRVLGEDEPEHRLHVMLECLLRAVGQDQPWDRYAEAWLEYVEQELWRDISRENWEQVTRLLSLLTAGATRQPAYADKALRLQLAIERMGSPEVRRRQVRHILEDAHSSRMTLLLCHYGPDAAKALLQQLPAELGRLFLHDSELLMGRLWYLHLPRRQTHALLTLLSLLVRISGEFPAPAESDDDADERREEFDSASLCEHSPRSLRFITSGRDETDAEPFHFVHPSLDDENALRVHRQVVNLCRHFGIQDICAQLSHLASTGQVLQPQNARTAYDELARLGMPTQKAGFDYKTFAKYYRK